MNTRKPIPTMKTSLDWVGAVMIPADKWSEGHNLGKLITRAAVRTPLHGGRAGLNSLVTPGMGRGNTRKENASMFDGSGNFEEKKGRILLLKATQMPAHSLSSPLSKAWKTPIRMGPWLTKGRADTHNLGWGSFIKKVRYFFQPKIK